MAKYDKNIVSIICDLICEDTYIIPEICKKVGIAESTYHEWKKTKLEFSEAIKKAEEARNKSIGEDARKSLRKIVNGYTVKEKQTITVDSGRMNEDGNPIPRVKEQKIIEKYIPPVPAAVFFALTNTDGINWKHRQMQEFSTAENQPLIIKKVYENKSSEK